jgi:hypothetical protein
MPAMFPTPVRVQILTVLFSFFFLLNTSWAQKEASAPSVESYYWPPGFFLQFGKLKQAQKEMMLSEVEKKLASLQQGGKGLLVRGDLVEKVRTDVPQINPATILDQSGMIMQVRNFPNIYYNFKGPEKLLSRNTFLVVKNPKVDRVESVLRQSLVMNADFFAFSKNYVSSTVDRLNKALLGPAEQQLAGPDGEAPARKKKRQ